MLKPMPTLFITNPANGERIAELPADDASSVAIQTVAARSAQADWARMPIAERLAAIRQTLSRIATERQVVVLSHRPELAEWGRAVVRSA